MPRPDVEWDLLRALQRAGEPGITTLPLPELPNRNPCAEIPLGNHEAPRIRGLSAATVVIDDFAVWRQEYLAEFVPDEPVIEVTPAAVTRAPLTIYYEVEPEYPSRFERADVV